MWLLAFLLAISCEAVAAVVSHGMRCRTLRPEPAALYARAAFASQQTFSSPKMRAAVKAESLLDVVDVLVAYDLSARKWLAENGKGAPLEYARRKVDEMNECLVNSRINTFRFRLVGTACIDEDATQYRSGGYVDLDKILSQKLVDGWGHVVAAGEWKKITDAREALGADVVSLLIDAGRHGNIGLGYALEDDSVVKFSKDPSQIPTFGDWAYSVCSIPEVDESYSMLHEIGHNMGCGHPDGSCASFLDIDLGPQLFGYSSGYYTWIGDEGYCTIMGYNFGGLRSDGSYNSHDRFTELPYFSSPLLTYEGVPLGSYTNDNRKTLLNSHSYVAQYRMAKLPMGAEPIRYGDEDSTVYNIFSSKFNPAKAINGTAPYIGAVYDGDKPVAIVSLKCGKAARSGKQAGTSKVSAVVTGFDGKQKKSGTVYVKCGYDATAVLTVKDLGTLSLTLGGEGFVGTLGNGLTVKTANVGGALVSAESVVDVDFSAGTAALPAGVLRNLLPTGENAEPVVSKGEKWFFAKAAAIKYKKVTDKATKEVHYELQGADDPVKTNRSAMKLTNTPKKGKFKGTFKVYALETSRGKSKLKKYSAKVSGIVVEGVGWGVAVIGGIGSFPVVVARKDKSGV